jgi:hypothetical protein
MHHLFCDKDGRVSGWSQFVSLKNLPRRNLRIGFMKMMMAMKDFVCSLILVIS